MFVAGFAGEAALGAAAEAFAGTAAAALPAGDASPLGPPPAAIAGDATKPTAKIHHANARIHSSLRLTAKFDSGTEGKNCTTEISES
jgi:hypothetical protein